MKKIYLRFPTTGKIISSKSGLNLKPQDRVLVNTEQIVEEAAVIEKPKQNAEIEEGAEILRVLTPEDRQRRLELKKKAKNFISETQKKVNRHGLQMEILDADLSFDEKKLTFYFAARGRVDFRSLVTDLAKSYNKLIRLQQVGVRDEAKFYGGIGKCGRELCCAKFLNNLESITLEMAEIQELATAGSAKLSGCCGKLMCCLAFEAQNYHALQDLKKKMPQIGTHYSSAEGEGKVISQKIIEGKVILETKGGEKLEVKV